MITSPSSKWIQRIVVVALSLAQLAPPSPIAQARAPQALKVAEPLARPAAGPGAGAGLAWLAAQQGASGAWSSAGPTVRDTSAAVIAFAIANNTGTTYNTGLDWLTSRSALTLTTNSTDSLARAFSAIQTARALEANEVLALLARRLADGSFGAAEGAAQGNAFDAALALGALSGSSVPLSLTSISLTTLATNPSATSDYSASDLPPLTVQGAATALMAFAAWQQQFNLQSPISNLQSLLSSRRKADGGYGDGAASSVRDAALAHIALWAVSGNNTALQNQLATTRAYLDNAQLGNGSWNNDVYDTALALRALGEVNATRITGTVIDSISNQPIPNATITVLASAPTLNATSNLSGAFTLNGIAPGRVNLQLAALGFVTRTITTTVQNAITNTLNAVKLTALPVSLAILSDPLVYEGTFNGDFGNSAIFTAQYTLPVGVTALAVQWVASNGRYTQGGINNTFGPNNLESFRVWTDEVAADCMPQCKSGEAGATLT